MAYFQGDQFTAEQQREFKNRIVVCQRRIFMKCFGLPEPRSPYCRPQWGIICGSEVPLRSDLNELVRTTRLEF